MAEVVSLPQYGGLDSRKEWLAAVLDETIVLLSQRLLAQGFPLKELVEVLEVRHRRLAEMILWRAGWIGEVAIGKGKDETPLMTVWTQPTTIGLVGLPLKKASEG